MHFNLNLICLMILGFLVGCKNDLPKPNDNLPLLALPPHFPPIKYDLVSNPVTQAGFDLGRKLFYDPILSRDSSISCGSCHQQWAAFAHSNHNVSHGIDGRNGTRNAPTLTNLIWKSLFMHDGGINHLDVQPFGPISNPVEMDQELAILVAKLNQMPEYKKQFKMAFGSDSIFSQRMFRAIVQFMAGMVSAKSQYDNYVQSDTNALTSLQKTGLAIFMQKCNACHTAPLFHDNGFHQILPAGSDEGRYLITLNTVDKYKFATPSLRNIALSAPYFHDGRANTLADVLRQKTLPPSSMALSDVEQTALLSFLESLTDIEFTQNKLFSEP